MSIKKTKDITMSFMYGFSGKTLLKKREWILKQQENIETQIRPMKGKSGTGKTRRDPFLEIWPEIEPLLEENPRLEAKTLFLHFSMKYPGGFQEGQL